MSQQQTELRFTEVRNSKTFKRIVNRFTLKDKKVLDLGCGYGEYMALCGKTSLGITTKLEEIDYGKANDVRIVYGNVEELGSVPELQKEKFEVMWSNNLFEHLLAPHAFLNSLKHYAGDDTLLILGVPVVPFPPDLMKMRKFKGAISVAHINFFTRDTLKLTAERAGWQVLEARPFIFSNKLLDHLVGIIAPHIYVIAKNDPAFTYHAKKVIEWVGVPYYSKVLETTGQN
jgi:SAM-dependent methyltransferase